MQTAVHPAITLENLSKDFTGTPAVSGISLEIFQGEFFGLLGPNGAGKTTTISMLTGLLKPSSGKILISQGPAALDPAEARAFMGFVPQEFAFYPSLSAADNLRFFGRLYGLRGQRLEQRIHEVLELAALTGRDGQSIGTFSNGMMRRLNIAIGLIHQPRILILDEPTAGVDAHSRNALLQALYALNRQGVTILYTTHLMEEAERLCHRIAIMDQGRILTVNTPALLIEEFGEGLIEVEFRNPAGEPLKQRMESLKTVEGVDGADRRWYLKTREPEKTFHALAALEEVRGLGIHSMKTLRPSLESVFIHLTGRGLRDPGQDRDPRAE